jgi:hypothetical protein
MDGYRRSYNTDLSQGLPLPSHGPYLTRNPSSRQVTAKHPFVWNELHLILAFLFGRSRWNLRVSPPSQFNFTFLIAFFFYAKRVLFLDKIFWLHLGLLVCIILVNRTVIFFWRFSSAIYVIKGIRYSINEIVNRYPWVTTLILWHNFKCSLDSTEKSGSWFLLPHLNRAGYWTI